MKNKKWEAKLVGVLAEDHEVDGGRSAVFVNNNDTIQFSIKIVSYEPNDFPRDVRLITCYSDELEKWGFEDDYTIKTDHEREQQVRDFLNDSLLIFQPELRYGTNFREYYVATNVYLIGKKDSFTHDLSLVPIPVFKEEDLTEAEFKSRLIETKFIGENPHISKHEEDTPSFLVWNPQNGEPKIYGEFGQHSVAHGGFRFIAKDSLTEIVFDSSLREEVYTWESCPVWFFPSEVHEIIIEKLSEAEPLNTLIEQRTDAVKVVDNKGEQENNIDKEELFVRELIDKTRELGLFYSEKDLYNFHIAMKTQSLVILAGMSGTGKSQLVSAYAKALGLPTSQINFIPVRPSWTDDTDLIGYPDTLNNVYRPGDSGLVNTLIKAESEKENLFIVCFDEMNLARVEHYFAQFLSVLETDTKVLKLYNDDLQYRFYNGEQYKPTVSIRDNVIFVGTVNLDETTYQFSDKVLDRANVIELDVLPYINLLKIEEKKESKLRSQGPTNAEDYAGFRDKYYRSVSLSTNELDFLWALHRVLQETASKMGIGPRIVRQIDRYIKNMPVSCPFTRKEAFDIQVVQRVLTKVRGSEDVLLSLTGHYKEDEDTVIDSKLFSVFDKFTEEVSDFVQSRNVIIQKARELKRNGYTI
ncbi:McrB family protein [Metabacillus fastidiosus]|uniref:McrB family protein n=1 Tax=Metabacillus fastidiosus TaxID=1458 RepID=UPI002E1D8FDF|nr:AAA family ATPase [Metabacillus fastidiosus]MED4455128.1 AAA family ATPase [Metabacillus fastidiosus]